MNEIKVAVLVDCDNTSPAILQYALEVATEFGRIVVRRGYGNHATLSKTWQDALVHSSFTPCLQYQYAAGKNTADIALALDAVETLFDQRADCFFVITSDSDFSYLCRKLRERGATVYIIGETKTPLALRNACDRFFEWIQPANKSSTLVDLNSALASRSKAEKKAAAPKPVAKSRPKFVVEAVRELTREIPEGTVSLSRLGVYLKRTDPKFSQKLFGYSRLVDMVKAYGSLRIKAENNGHYVVGLGAHVGTGNGAKKAVEN